MLLPDSGRHQKRWQIGVNFFHQNQNRVPIYCVKFSGRSPGYFIFYKSHYVSSLVTSSVKPEEFFNTATGLFVIQTDANGSTTAVSKAKESDFEIKYVDNISGKNTGMKDSKGNNYNIAYVYVVAKDGTGYTGTRSFTTADGTTIKSVVDYVAFAIKNVKFVKQNVYVQNATYAGGLPVKTIVNKNGRNINMNETIQMLIHA